MGRSFWVYIITDKPYGMLYIGVTNDLPRRIFEHKNESHKGFSKRYGLKLLVYCEEYPTAIEAIQREKQLKKWKRDWKIQLIKDANPKWQDLYENLN